ncbi:MAG: thiamine phosphate synthase, partial [Alphaproteobacteria bacterium]
FGRKSFDLSVYVIIDPAVLPKGRGVGEVTLAALRGGATFLQLRNKVDSLDVVREQALEIVRLLDDPLYRTVVFVMDDYVALAAELDLDGVHVGQEDMPAAQARELIGDDKILGLTAYKQAHYDALDSKIVDYVGTGPVYPTLTKPDKAVLGIGGFANLVANAPVPVVGIGGITPDNASDVIHAGADGVAMIRAVVAALDPEGATQDFVSAVQRGRRGMV